MFKLKLIFVRHGLSEWNKLNQFTGWMDADLSEQGYEEAHKAGQKIKNAGINFDFAFTSVLKRAIKTCHIVLEESDQLWVPETKSWRLNERHYGALQGLNKAATEEEFGSEQVLIWRRSYDTLPPLLKPDDPNSAWRTTHFDYHAIDQDVLKLDILGHDDPTIIRMLQDITGVDPQKIPLDDQETMSIFSSTKALGITPEQIKSEFKSVVDLIFEVYKDFNITDYRCVLSLRDPEDKEKYHPDDEMWDKAENELREVLNELGIDYTEEIGEAAFYGPKLDVNVKPAVGGEYTLSTCQLDFCLPAKFDLKYVDKDGTKKTPVVLHRAILGSLDRFMAYILEETKGILPTWLSPVQVNVIPVNNDYHLDYCIKLKEELILNNIRVAGAISATVHCLHQQLAFPVILPDCPFIKNHHF